MEITAEQYQQLMATFMLQGAIQHALILTLQEKNVLRPAQMRALFDAAAQRLREAVPVTKETGTAEVALAQLESIRRGFLDA